MTKLQSSIDLVRRRTPDTHWSRDEGRGGNDYNGLGGEAAGEGKGKEENFFGWKNGPGFWTLFSRSVIGGKWRIAHRSTQSYFSYNSRRVHVVLLMKREENIEIQLFNAKRLPKKI